MLCLLCIDTGRGKGESHFHVMVTFLFVPRLGYLRTSINLILISHSFILESCNGIISLVFTDNILASRTSGLIFGYGESSGSGSLSAF